MSRRRNDYDSYDEYDLYEDYDDRLPAGGGRPGGRNRRDAYDLGGRADVRDDYRDPRGYDDYGPDTDGAYYGRTEDAGYYAGDYGPDDYAEDGYDAGYADDGYRDAPDDYDYDPYDERQTRSRRARREDPGCGDDYDDRRYERDLRNARGQDSRGGNRRGGRKKGKGRIILFAVEIIALVVVIALLYMSKKVEKVGKVALDDTRIESAMNEGVKESTETGVLAGYQNIALFGVDSRDENLAAGNNRSDTIMIASINRENGEIKLCSIYRDTYLNIGSDRYTKCNAAYAKGGPEQAINMLNQNLDLDITDFITIGFRGLTDVVDDVGGVDIDVDDAELPHLNSYQLTMSQELNYPYEELTNTGVVHLNGLQATAYCRIRYTAGSDFKRTERQREVLTAVFQKAQTMDVTALDQMATDVFSEVYTSFDLTNDLMPMLANLTSYKIVDQNGFPQEDQRVAGTVKIDGVGQSCVVPRDLDTNVQWLHGYLFGDTTYTVSADVEQISQKIAADTANITQ